MCIYNTLDALAVILYRQWHFDAVFSQKCTTKSKLQYQIGMFFRTNKNVVAVIFFFLQIVKDKGEAFETNTNIFA